MQIVTAHERLLGIRTQAQHRVITSPMTAESTFRMQQVTLLADEALFLIDDEGLPVDAALSGLSRSTAAELVDRVGDIETLLIESYKVGIVNADQVDPATHLLHDVGESLSVTMEVA